MEQATLKVNR